jgi:hypothetical protein
LDPNPQNTPLAKAIRRAALYLAIAVASFFVLGFAALYLPEDMTLDYAGSKNRSEVQDWLPGKEVIPPDMILIERYKTTNQESANRYPNRDEMLRWLEGWGRKESYSNLYLSRDRCTPSGPQSIRLSIILHKDETGAQQYLDWLKERDRSTSADFQTLDIGNGGHQFWQVTEDPCSDKTRKKVEIIFRHNHALGVVGVAGGWGQDEQLQEIALRLAGSLDDCIRKETQPR